MFLTIDEMKDLVVGAVEMELRDGLFHFYRFTAEQAETYLTVHNNEDFYTKTFATAGVRLECKTDATTFGFSFKAKRCSSRHYCRFDVYVNDVLINYMEAKDLADDWEGEFHMDLPAGEKKLTLYFPNFFGMAIGDVELADATFAEPCTHKYTMVCYGDSITQGYDAYCPSLSYVNRLAAALDAAVVDKGIGGDRFNPVLLPLNDGEEPDLVTVAYGTNDWSGCTREALESNLAGFMKGLAERYSHAKIFVATPIWRGNYLATDKKAGSFESVTELIKAEAEKYGYTVIPGMELVPHDPVFFAEDQLHPNDLGHLWYGEQFAKVIQKHL